MARPWVAILLCIGAGLCACGCFQYSPYQVPTDESEHHLNRKAIERITVGSPPEPFRFAVLGDTQRALDEAAAAVDSLNHQEGLAFVIQVGDLTDHGLLKEYRQAEDILARLSVPHVVVIGNHDFLGNGDLIFKKMFGPLNDAFAVGRTKIVLIDTNSLEADKKGIVPDLNWLEAQLEPSPDFDQAVVFSHIAPDNRDFDEALKAGYASALAAGRAVLSAHGHEHAFRAGEFFADGVQYVVVDAIADRFYFIFTAQPGGFGLERVAF